MTNQELTPFVLRYYQQGKLNTQQAMKAVLERLANHAENPEARKAEGTVRRLHLSARLRYAAAVAVLCVLVGTAFALFYQPSGRNTAEPPAVTTQQPSPNAPTKTFHFDDTPINQVLAELSDCYGANLQASDTTKHLTGDFEADDLPMLIDMIEQTLQIHIIFQ